MFGEGTGEGNIASRQERPVQSREWLGKRGGEDEHELVWLPRATSRFLGAVEEIGKGSLFTRSQSCHFSLRIMGIHRGNLSREQMRSDLLLGKITLVAKKGINEDQAGVERILIDGCKHPDKRQ